MRMVEARTQRALGYYPPVINANLSPIAGHPARLVWRLTDS
jgi:hypothetical protein